MSKDQDFRKGSIAKYRNHNIEVRVKKTTIGAWKTWIKDLKVDTERIGPYCPGNPDNFDFDIVREIWISKK